MLRVSVLVAAIWAVGAHGQYLYSVGGTIGTNSITSICNETFNDANTTGFYDVNANVAQLPQQSQPENNSGNTLPIKIGVTVTETSANLSGSVEWSLWLNTNGANYSNDASLGYDVCMFTIAPISTNTLLRGQTDTGNCLATFDVDCKSALEDAASGYALGLIQNATPEPNSNLSEHSLSKVCYDVANSLESNFPEQCQKYMNDTSIIIGPYALTDSEHTGLYNGCTLTDTNDGDIYHFLYTASGQTQNSPAKAKTIYAGFNWNVAAIITTWMPIAYVNAGQSIAEASSKLSCIHATNVNPGSEKPIAAPSPTPVGSGGGLSGGAIAGIVVGAVLGVGLIAGAAYWFWRRRRASKKNADGSEHPPAYTDAKEQPTEVPAGPGYTELSPDNQMRPELPTHQSGPRTELSGDSRPSYDKRVNSQPAELFAEVPNSGNFYGR